MNNALLESASELAYLGDVIKIVDVGYGSAALIDHLRDTVRQAECVKRGVRFLPEQVIRRLVFELKLTPGHEFAIKPGEMGLS